METILNRELQITRLIDAPRELVWKVWTDPQHIKNWWGPNGFTNTISKMEVKEGGVWEFIMHGPDGTDYKNKHIYKEIVKPERLVLSHETAPKFLMTATFEAQGNKTMVTLHSVFESAEQLQEVIKVFKADDGMKQNMDKMQDYLEKLNTGSQPGTGPFVMERILNAPVSKVWKAITDKEEMKKWYFDLSDFKPVVGFEFHFYGEGSQCQKYLHRCKVMEVIPQKKLSYSWRYEDFEGNSLVTFELSGEKETTLLRLTHSGLESFPSNNPDFARESFAGGWTEIIGTTLKAFVEKGM